MNFRSQTGITLIEVMIAVFLLGIALSGIIFTLQLNLTNADNLRNNTIAAGLAQEGLEVVRNIRDQEWLTSLTFGNNLSDGNHEVQWNSTSLLADSSRYLKKDAATKLFSYDSGSDTIFKRAVAISTVSANEKMITVTVTWSVHGATHTVTAEDHLFNWY